jgi:hypothetical protein
MEPSKKKMTKLDLVTELLWLLDKRYFGVEDTTAQCPVCKRWHRMYSVMQRHLIYKHNKAELMNTYLRLTLEAE